MVSIDTGKAEISRYNIKDNIILVDIYADGELYKQDLDNIHGAIAKFDVLVPVDTICVKSGEHYLSEDALEYSKSHHCIHNKIIFVIKHMADIHYPSIVQHTLFKDHMVDYCASTDEAYWLLMDAKGS